MRGARRQLKWKQQREQKARRANASTSQGTGQSTGQFINDIAKHADCRLDQLCQLQAQFGTPVVVGEAACIAYRGTCTKKPGNSCVNTDAYEMATAELFVTLNDGVSWVPLLEFSLTDLSLTRLREAVLAAAGLQDSARRFAYQEAGMKVKLISDAQLQSWVDRGEGPKQLFFISVPAASPAPPLPLSEVSAIATSRFVHRVNATLVVVVAARAPTPNPDPRSNPALNPERLLVDEAYCKYERIVMVLRKPKLALVVALAVPRLQYSASTLPASCLLAASWAVSQYYSIHNGSNDYTTVHNRIIQRLLQRCRADEEVSGDGTTERLTIALATALSSDPIGLQHQPFVAGAVNKCFIEVLSLVDGHLPLNLQLGLKFHRDVGDSGVSLHPDVVIRDRDGIRLLFKAEEKDELHNINVPIEELCSKTGVWSPLYYGQLTYLLTMAVAGACVQFCAIKRGSPATAKLIGPPLQMDNIVSRAHIIIATFNLHRLLAIVAANLPASVLPVDKDVVLCHTNWGYTRTLHFMSTELLVYKRIKPWSKYVAAWHVDFAHLKDVYSRTACAAGLVHAAGDTPTLDARDDKYTVALHPLGLQGSDAVPLNERELQHAAHGLLHGLQALHEANFEHRDLRLANCACDISKTRFFLLDLETCAPADAEVTSIHMSHWS
ncbi:hypothetical protein JKP88DRAFT_264559 [Tribonema minus]|uniref:Protein kinase domain-containing protein n=1 Tax=Tribonema minus TaxID=303371 RepID=A0A835YP73_9STRA|nr:hypothetical protein JKP88DRAFT_264559 [Tribonema minus]